MFRPLGAHGHAELDPGCLRCRVRVAFSNSRPMQCDCGARAILLVGRDHGSFAAGCPRAFGSLFDRALGAGSNSPSGGHLLSPLATLGR